MKTLALPIDFSHFTCLLFTVPILLVVRVGLTKLFFALARLRHYPEATARKIAESGYYFLQYLVLYLFSRSIVRYYGIQPYHFDNFFDAYPARLQFDPVYNKWFMSELTVYLVSSILLLFESRKSYSDFLVMIIHHIVSCTLCVAGYGFRHFTFGLVLGNLHDASDIFLEGSKVLNYTIGEPWSLFTFILFACVFFVARIVIYPTYLIFPVMFGKCDRLVAERYGPEVSCGETIWHRWGFYAVLLTLYALDVYWMKTILRMAVGICKLEVRGDIRDSEETATGRELRSRGQSAA